MPKPKNWYSITAMAPGGAEIIIYDEIGMWGITAKDFIDDLKALGNITDLTVRINSPGGSIFDGNAIYNVLNRHNAQVTVYVDGIAASIASIIAMAGDIVIMPENAMMMIHDPSGLVWGTADDMEEMAAALTKMKAGMVASYRAKSGLPDEEIENIMSDETWLTAEEAVEKGFADEVEAAVQMAANFDLSKFKHAPSDLSAHSPRAAGAHQPSSKEETTMPNPANKSAPASESEKPEITVDSIMANNPTIADHFRAEGNTEGHTEATTRIKAILDHDEAKGRETTARHIAFNTAMGVDDAVAMLSSTTKIDPEATLGENYIAAAQGDEVGTAKVPPAPTSDGGKGIDANAPLEDRAKAKWDSTPDIRAEFGDKFDRFLAYEKANAEGRVKLLGNNA